MDTWFLEDGADIRDPRIPVAIPSFNREVALVTQTLSTLRRYRWPLELVFVFVHPSHVRKDGISELLAYKRYLAHHGFETVNLRVGGATLRSQYDTIFTQFRGHQLLVMSDTVPDFITRTHAGNATVKSLEQTQLLAYVTAGFRITAAQGGKAWSFWTV